EVRHRGLAARSGPVPGAHLVLELHRLPGPPPADPRSESGRLRGGAPHVERNRDRGRTNVDRALGEPPAGRRERAPPRGPAPLPSRVPARAAAKVRAGGRPQEARASHRKLAPATSPWAAGSSAS